MPADLCRRTRRRDLAIIASIPGLGDFRNTAIAGLTDVSACSRTVHR